MEIYLSSETEGRADSLLLPIRNMVDSLLDDIRKNEYGSALTSVGVFAIIMKEEMYDSGGYCERQYYSKVRKEADIRLRLPEKVAKWARELKGQGIKLYILSNTNQEEKVKRVANALEIPYEYFAKKPLKSGFLKVQKSLNEKPENIGVVGDQIFTDIIGGNRCKMFTILVDPIEPIDYWYTAWKRPIENKIKIRYKNKRTKEKK